MSSAPSADYPGGSRVLEVGCGVGAQTVTLARRSPGARFTAVDVSADSIAQAEREVGHDSPAARAAIQCLVQLQHMAGGNALTW